MAVATNIPVLFMTGFVVQGHIWYFANSFVLNQTNHNSKYKKAPGNNSSNNKIIVMSIHFNHFVKHVSVSRLLIHI